MIGIKKNLKFKSSNHFSKGHECDFEGHNALHIFPKNINNIS